jgi:cyclopropane fatty-acyl-phospholipid synthase-like methyltransferase
VTRRRAAPAFVLAVACLVAPAVHGQAQGHAHRGAADHRFDDAERWARVFDDPARDAWQQPDAVIHALKLAPDAAVADIGAGTGYFAVRLARAVPKGRVVGVDASADMVRYLGERAKREGLANLAAQLGGADDPRLAAPVDLALLVDVYHHLGAREKYFERVRASLKPGGRVAIVDFRMESTRGPPPSGRVPPGEVRAELARAGFELAEEHSFLPDQYFLVFRAAAK